MRIAIGTPDLTEVIRPLEEAGWHSLTRMQNRRSTMLIVVFLSICLLDLPAEAGFAGGSGTADDPYQIATAEHILSIGSERDLLDKHFVLVKDIDLDPNLPGGRVFESAVIAPSELVPARALYVDCRPFTGNFDGNGHTVDNLFIEAEGEWAAYIGLFGCIEGHVRNIQLENVNISGTYVVGGLAGSNQGTITACTVAGSITGRSQVGAVAGRNEGTINSCHARGEVRADEKVGGLVGCHAAGTIAFSYSVVQVVGTSDVGGLVGASEEGTVYLSYWDIDTSGVQISAGGRGKQCAFGRAEKNLDVL